MDTPDSTVRESYFDAVGVIPSSQDLRYCALNLSACPLILLEDYGDKSAGLNLTVKRYRHAEIWKETILTTTECRHPAIPSNYWRRTRIVVIWMISCLRHIRVWSFETCVALQVSLTSESKKRWGDSYDIQIYFSSSWTNCFATLDLSLICGPYHMSSIGPIASRKPTPPSMLLAA